MKIKETIYTELDSRGRVIKRTRTIDIDDPYIDRGYDFGTRFCGCGEPQQSSYKRIYEAYRDYRDSQQWK